MQRVGQTTLDYFIKVTAEEEMQHFLNADVTQSLEIISKGYRQ